MITKGLFRLAILPGTLAGFYCNETTNGQYFSECAMAAPLSLMLGSTPSNLPMPLYEHLHDSYDTIWHERNEPKGVHTLTIEVDSRNPDSGSNPNQFNLTWSNGPDPIFKGTAQRHGDWLYGNYWEVDKEKK